MFLLPNTHTIKINTFSNSKFNEAGERLGFPSQTITSQIILLTTVLVMYRCIIFFLFFSFILEIYYWLVVTTL